MSSNIDGALEQLGRPGCFHIVVYLCLGINNLVVVTNHLAMVVFAPKTSHQCSVPEQNTTAGEEPVLTSGECVLHQNVTYYGNWTLEDVPCPGQWEYEDEKNIVAQFDLVCDRAYLIHLATTVYFCGVMLGGLVFGSLSDMFGRKPFLLLTLYTQTGIGVWNAFTNSFDVFMFLRFLQGFLMQGLQTTSLVLIMELFPKRYRTVVGSVFEVFWAMGVMWLALVAYALENWRYIQLAIALPSVITIAYIWLIPESVRWLVAHEKYSKADRVLKRAARFNRIEIPDNSLEKTLPQSGELLEKGTNEAAAQQVEAPVKKKPNLIDMFRNKELRKRSIIQFYIWFVVTTTYYGISLRLSSFAGNKYLNFFYGGLCELPAYCAAYFIVNRFGRKHPLVLYLFAGGVTGVTAGIFSQIFGSAAAHLAWLPTFMAVLSRVSMAGCFSILWLYSSELYPTVIRNVSVGACTFWMRVGAMMAPQILHLGDKTYPFLPIIIFGCLCLLGGGLTFLLPETRGTKLPETIADVHVTGPKQQPGSRESILEVNSLNESSKTTDPADSRHLEV